MNDIPANSINQPQANPASVNTNPVVPNKPKSSSNKKTCIILAVVGVVIGGGLILMAITVSILTSTLGTSDVSEQKAVSNSTAKNVNVVVPASKVNTDTSDLEFADGEGLPPISKSYADTLLTKTFLLSPYEGYFTSVDAVGRPSYTFALSYNKDWKVKKRDIYSLVLQDETDQLNYGIVSFDSNLKVYGYTCEQLVKDIYKGDDVTLTILSNESVTVNGEVWDRVEYKNDDGSIRGVDQCLRRSGLLIDQFIATNSENWNANSFTYMKMLDDVYVSLDASAW